MLRALCNDYALFALSTAKALVLLPLLLVWLGDEMYGVWALIIAATGYLNLANFGVAGGVVRRLAEMDGARSMGEADESDRRRSLATASLLFLAQAAVLTPLALLIAWASSVIATGAESPAIRDAPVAAIVLLVAARLVVGVLVQIWPSILYAHRRLDELYAAQSVGVAATFVATVVVVLNDWGLVGLAIANLVGFAPEAVMIRWSARRALRASGEANGGRWHTRDATRTEAAHQFSVGGWLLVVSLAGLVQSRTSVLILGAVAGTPQVTLLDVNQRPWRLGLMLLRKLPNVLWPRVSEALGARDQRTARRHLKTMLVPSAILAAAGVGAALPAAPALMTLWVGAERWGGWIMGGALALSALLGCIHHGLHLATLAAGKTRAPALASAAEVVLHLALLYYTASRWGAVGAAVAGVLAHVITTFWFAAWYTARTYDIRPLHAARRLLLPVLLAGTLASLLSSGTLMYLPDAFGSWLRPSVALASGVLGGLVLGFAIDRLGAPSSASEPLPPAS